jgi:H+-transporting ATPase
MAAIVEVASSNSSTKPVGTTSSSGLTSAEARSRLQKDGPNATPDVSAHSIRNALAKFWAPVPWLLEASIVLQVVLHKYAEARSLRAC